MGFKDSSRILERFYLALLFMSVFGFSATSDCDDFDLKSVRGDGEGWGCFCFQDSSDCFMCFQHPTNIDCAELVLPCFNQSQSFTETEIHISYLFRRGNSGSEVNRVPLNVYEEEESNCTVSYFSATLLDNEVMTPGSQLQRSNFRAGNLSKRNINPTTSYRLNIVESMGSFPSMSIVCLTKVEFIGSETTVAVTTEIAQTTTNVTTTSKVRSETTDAVTKGIAPTTTDVRTTNEGSLSTSDGEKNTEQEQTQSSFPIWVIVLIILIVVIGVFAVVGVFIRQRNHHDHQPDSNVNTEATYGHSNQIKATTKHDKDVILNPTYGHDPVSEQDEEYHSYTEIDVNVPTNSEMIYNSAYESQPPFSGMIYNSAYESSSN
ncbi:hypothetical protein HOLleu_23466 [Holothuria leucospilota]|uniref:Uncharacterized protein n=1 Tax=Holothuria leucospilota TaxID=206669 RepID=A0A9Q1BV25_HOLLE|nr:hypothetical protein HOLleu_23466 [Holothuria leucospilota]